MLLYFQFVVNHYSVHFIDNVMLWTFAIQLVLPIFWISNKIKRLTKSDKNLSSWTEGNKLPLFSINTLIMYKSVKFPDPLFLDSSTAKGSMSWRAFNTSLFFYQLQVQSKHKMKLNLAQLIVFLSSILWNRTKNFRK